MLAPIEREPSPRYHMSWSVWTWRQSVGKMYVANSNGRKVPLQGFSQLTEKPFYSVLLKKGNRIQTQVWPKWPWAGSRYRDSTECNLPLKSLHPHHTALNFPVSIFQLHCPQWLFQRLNIRCLLYLLLKQRWSFTNGSQQVFPPQHYTLPDQLLLFTLN